MLPREEEKVEQLVESPNNNQLSTQSTMTVKNPQLDATKSILLESLGSRGSAMLKAALNAKNGQNYSNPINGSYSSTTEEQKRIKLMKHAEELKNRRRSPKNKVLFTEPLVTSHHEYEQTIIIDIEQEERGSDDQLGTDQVVENYGFENKDKEVFYAEYCMKFYNRLNHFNDSDKRQERNPYYRKGRKKRSYEVAMKGDDEACDDSGSQTSSNDGSLFSSPKIAKIAPYYHNHADAGRQVVSKQDSADRNPTNTNDANHNNSSEILPNRSQRTKVSKLLLPTESRSSKPKGAWSVELESKKVVTELLSVKKVSIDHQFDESPPTCDSPRPQQSYFSWISNGLNYLSSQMNKLIF